MGAYVPPHNAPAVHHIKQALEVAPNVMEVIILGDLDIRIRGTRDDRVDELASSLTGSELGDMTDHFTLRRRYQGMGS